MAELFKIVTEGKLRDGVDMEQFITQFSNTFKLSAEQAKKLLSAERTVTLKDKLDRGTAEKFQRVLQEQLGLIVRIEAVKTQSSISHDSISYESPSSHSPDPDSNDQSQVNDTGIRCPKCGSNRVSGDDCLACGIIISRYRAREAETAQTQNTGGNWNPYQSTGTEDVEEDSGFVVRKVATGDGWSWIVGGWRHFTGNPFAWIGALIIWYLIMIVAGLIPFIGSIGINILSPVFVAGIMLGAREQDKGGNFTVGHLFKGFSTEFPKLIQAGLLYVVATVLVILVGGIIFAFSGMGLFFQHAGAVGYGAGPSLIGIFFLFLVVMVAMALLAMAFYYVPLLIVFEGMGPIDAVKNSFSACWKNAIPFLVYGLMMMGLGIVAAIPLGLGLIVFAPVVAASAYVSYRSIFHGEAA